MIIKGEKCNYEVIIGLEVHAQISSETKLFSGSPNDFGSHPNKSANHFDIASPGTLPILNINAMQKAIMAGLGIHGKIRTISTFDRKGYFYPDLPAGYQITQFYNPLVYDGYLDIFVNNNNKRIRIERIHVEQDAGKLIHDISPNESHIDLNRAGAPLMEIVSMPDMRDADEVVAYLKSLRHLLRHIGASDCDMEKGCFRCDVNISVKPEKSDTLGTRCEIKNVNSFRFIAKAIQYEAHRQVSIIEDGRKVIQETRSFDSDSSTTKSLRDKVDAIDYRYFPDPNILPFIIKEKTISDIKNNMPELPEIKIQRYTNLYSLSFDDAMFLIEEMEYAEYFDFAVKECQPRLCATWIIVEFCGRLKKINIQPNQSNVKKESMVSLIKLIDNGKINGKTAKTVLDDMISGLGEPKDIVEKKGLLQLSKEETTLAVMDVLKTHDTIVEQYKSGKHSVFGFLVGEVMKKTKGRAETTITNDILKNELTK